MVASGTRTQRSNWPFALVVGLPALAVFEARWSFDGYTAVVGRLLERGVPSVFFRLDGYLVLALGALLGARLAAGRGEVLRALGVEQSILRGFAIGSIIAVPSLLLASLVSDGARWPGAESLALLSAPIAIEGFFRGLLVSIPVRLGGRRSWSTAALAGVAFGTMSVPWEHAASWGWVPDFLLMTVEGVWLAWLVRCYRWNLWVAIGLNAWMRAAWAIFAVADGEGAVAWPHVALGLNIATGTLMAIRHRYRQHRGARGGGAPS